MSEFENFNDPSIYIHDSAFTNNKHTTVVNFLKLLKTYHVLFNKNIVTKKIHYVDFIYKQGMKCLNHIYTILLYYTNNMSFTYYHCEKGIYYFTEFISQIENENSFLKLSSIDAIIFVYKKTIYNINKKLCTVERKNWLNESNNIIKLIISINTFENFDKLTSYFMKLSKASHERIEKLYVLTNECTTSNDLLEALKQVL